MTTPTTTPVHVVLGAGPAGRTTAAELASRGHDVRVVDRSATDIGVDGVEVRQADLSDPAVAAEVTAGAAVIYHCVNVAYHLQVDVMPRIAESVLTAAEANGARLVVLDTLYPYGPTDGEHITEQTPWAATSRKGRMRAELDRRYLRAHEEGRVRTVMGRSADFFGPHVLNSTLGATCFPPALAGEKVLAFGDIDLPHSYSFVPDVASGLATLGEDSRGDGRVWHLPTVPAVSTRHVHAVVGELVGHPVEALVLPEAKPYGPFDETFMAEYAEMFYQHLVPQNMVSAAFEKEFGARPTPLRAALDRTLAWYREVSS